VRDQARELVEMRRLNTESVDTCARDPVVLESFEKSGFVDDASSGCVDDESVWPHVFELLFADDTTSAIKERNMNAQDIDGGGDLFDGLDEGEVAGGNDFLPSLEHLRRHVGIVNYNATSESAMEHAADLECDVASANEAECLARELKASGANSLLYDLPVP
jgi:hypothetical protein